MNKVEKHIRDGHRRGNYRILKASLKLLSRIIAFSKFKQPSRQNNATFYKFTHKVKFNSKIVLVETSFSSNYGVIR